MIAPEEKSADEQGRAGEYEQHTAETGADDFTHQGN
jgi:hypothetical protein